MAAILFLRAGTGKGSGVFARELAERFDWSRPTANKVINALVSRGLLSEHRTRNPDGTYRAITYTVPRLPRDLRNATVKSPGHGTPGHGASGHSRRVFAFHALPSEEPAVQTVKGSYASASAEAPTLSVAEQAESCDALLGWIRSDKLARALANSVEPEVIAEVAAALPDAELRKRLLEANHKRVAPAILTPAGLYAVRYLAASLVDMDLGPSDAIAAVLNAICAGIGSRSGAWLNSLALVGKRMAAEAYTSGEARFYADQPKSLAQGVALDDPYLLRLARAAGAKSLAPKLLRDGKGLRAFLAKHGGDDVLEIMVTILWRHVIDGKVPGSVKTWRYFEAAIAEEKQRAWMRQEGVRDPRYLPMARICGSWRASQLWNEPCGCVPTDGRLHRPNSQWRETGRLAGRTTQRI